MVTGTSGQVTNGAKTKETPRPRYQRLQAIKAASVLNEISQVLKLRVSGACANQIQRQLSFASRDPRCYYPGTGCCDGSCGSSCSSSTSASKPLGL